MSYHAFSLDPHTVLGVRPGASPDELQEAYHAKSKKHHPDAGGDEWAFRMVVSAYEVLKATARSCQAGASGGGLTRFRLRNNDGPGRRMLSFSRADFSTSGWEGPRETAEDGSAPRSSQSAEEEPDPASPNEGEFRAEPDGLRNVNVELVWTRYEKDAAGRFLSSHESDDSDPERMDGHFMAVRSPRRSRGRVPLIRRDFTHTDRTLRAATDQGLGCRGQVAD